MSSSKSNRAIQQGFGIGRKTISFLRSIKRIQRMKWSDPRVVGAFVVFAYFVFSYERNRYEVSDTQTQRIELERDRAKYEREIQEVNQKIRLYEIQNKAKNDVVDVMPINDLDSLWAVIHR
jgi:hypothetical protein